MGDQEELGVIELPARLDGHVLERAPYLRDEDVLSENAKGSIEAIGAALGPLLAVALIANHVRRITKAGVKKVET